jgi:hypothetical protein
MSDLVIGFILGGIVCLITGFILGGEFCYRMMLAKEKTKVQHGR